ncbi:DUF3667 domain-containing protein [Longimicrobium terrae]|uniref:DUF3667 domain-containing protein n=1 Tax=Longimicrobium terrae TaxID=1639882 RepID=A0A841H8R5_9BACT|nr:DUF3667 domain-containing protein [Longimicrobium terrae]MBB4639683.1 hypothetical protein [Longimicrobium terrae]MBB6074079.1 hypothetical protein [Longimicrobium terrae]NNC28697.1 DUF3667 domain-containing protein [Longimicrobium terrae]
MDTTLSPAPASATPEPIAAPGGHPALIPGDGPVAAVDVAPARILAPPPPVPACANCGAALTGRFCAECGQKRVEGRLSVRQVAMETVASAADMDRGLLHTVAGLTLRPGEVVRDYLNGATVRWTGPAKYFVLVMAMVVLVYVQAGIGERLAAVSGSAAGTEGIVKLVQTHMNLLMAAGVPFSALGTWVMYRRYGLNYAEHVVLNLYVNAHHTLLMVPLSVAAAFGGFRVLMVANTLLGFGYLVWVARATFGIGTGAAILRTLGAQALNMIAAGTAGIGVGYAIGHLIR